MVAFLFSVPAVCVGGLFCKYCFVFCSMFVSYYALDCPVVVRTERGRGSEGGQKRGREGRRGEGES